MSCGAGRRCGLDPVLLWLWLAAAAQIQPLAWGLSCATGVALEQTKEQKTKKPLNFLYLPVKSVIVTVIMVK